MSNINQYKGLRTKELFIFAKALGVNITGFTEDDYLNAFVSFDKGELNYEANPKQVLSTYKKYVDKTPITGDNATKKMIDGIHKWVLSTALVDNDDGDKQKNKMKTSTPGTYVVLYIMYIRYVYTSRMHVTYARDVYTYLI